MIKRNRWTNQEDLVLRKLYSILSNNEIAELLNDHYGNGRNAASVGLRARRIGMRKAVER